MTSESTGGFGEVRQGRSEHCVGTYAKGFNSYLGIVLIGDFSSKDNRKPAFDSNAFDVVELRIRIRGEAAREFGRSIGVLDFGDKVLHFWEEHV